MRSFVLLATVAFTYGCTFVEVEHDEGDSSWTERYPVGKCE